MKIGGIIWLRDIVDKLAFNHHVEVDEAIVPKLNEIAKSKKVPPKSSSILG
jgi:hypothetical protein